MLFHVSRLLLFLLQNNNGHNGDDNNCYRNTDDETHIVAFGLGFSFLCRSGGLLGCRLGGFFLSGRFFCCGRSEGSQFHLAQSGRLFGGGSGFTGDAGWTGTVLKRL